MIKLSIIITSYNSMASLSRCVNSVIPQLRDGVELIIVDDGSTDGSSLLCNQIASSNQFIRVFHQMNNGVSVTRNTGIINAKGDFLMFLDSDDFLSPDAVQTVLNTIHLCHPDCINFGWQYVTKDGAQVGQATGLPKNQLLDKQFIHDYILPPLLNLRKDEKSFIFDFSVNKVYRSDIIKVNKVYFDETRRIWEDRPFLVKYLKYCASFYCLPDILYNYVQTEGSLSQKFYINMFEIILKNYRQYVTDYGDEYSFDEPYVYWYWSHSIENMIKRALKEKDRDGSIYSEIKRIIADPDVISWFKKRQSENEFEDQIREYVIAGDADSLIRKMRKAIIKDTWIKNTAMVTLHVKQSVKRLFRI